MTEQAETHLNLDYRDPEWLAQELGIEKNTVYKLLNDGTIPAVRLGRKWLVSPAEVREFLRHQQELQTERRRVEAWLGSEYRKLTGRVASGGEVDAFADDIYHEYAQVSHQGAVSPKVGVIDFVEGWKCGLAHCQTHPEQVVLGRDVLIHPELPPKWTVVFGCERCRAHASDEDLPFE